MFRTLFVSYLFDNDFSVLFWYIFMSSRADVLVQSCYTPRYRNPLLTSCSTSISHTRTQFRITQKKLYTSEKIHWVSKYSKSLKNLNWWLIASDLMAQCTKRLITSFGASGLFTQISSISILTSRWIVQNVRKCVNQRARASRPVG